MSYMMSYMFVNCQLRTRVIHHATSDNDSARSELDHKVRSHNQARRLT